MQWRGLGSLIKLSAAQRSMPAECIHSEYVLANMEHRQAEAENQTHIHTPFLEVSITPPEIVGVYKYVCVCEWACMSVYVHMSVYMSLYVCVCMCK